MGCTATVTARVASRPMVSSVLGVCAFQPGGRADKYDQGLALYASLGSIGRHFESYDGLFYLVSLRYAAVRLSICRESGLLAGGATRHKFGKTRCLPGGAQRTDKCEAIDFS